MLLVTSTARRRQQNVSLSGNFLGKLTNFHRHVTFALSTRVRTIEGSLVVMNDRYLMDVLHSLCSLTPGDDNAVAMKCKG